MAVWTTGHGVRLVIPWSDLNEGMNMHQALT